MCTSNSRSLPPTMIKYKYQNIAGLALLFFMRYFIFIFLILAMAYLSTRQQPNWYSRNIQTDWEILLDIQETESFSWSSLHKTK